MSTAVNRIVFGRTTWAALIRELRRRGDAQKESGAFLLARPGSPLVVRAAYYDDLDPTSLDSGYIQFDGSGYVPLSGICEESGLRIIGDVHTHPGSWTGQSQVDRDHPMMARAGHIALIVPYFARKNRFTLKGVSAYLYQGNGQWQNLGPGLGLRWL
jgi:proteasome lid subunit RPN8/RPN11